MNWREAHAAGFDQRGQGQEGEEDEEQLQLPVERGMIRVRTYVKGWKVWTYEGTDV